MSTNYYLDNPDNEEGHIGKWAAGHFIAKAPEGVDSFAGWKAMLQGHRIFAEHGVEYTPEQMIEMVKPDDYGRRNIRGPRYENGEWIEETIPSRKENEISSRTTCQHCGNIILRHRDGMWLSDPMRDLSRGRRCTTSPDGQHAPASADQATDPEILRLRARLAELEAKLGR